MWCPLHLENMGDSALQMLFLVDLFSSHQVPCQTSYPRNPISTMIVEGDICSRNMLDSSAD